MQVINLEQGGRAWMSWRKKGIGASDAPVIMGVSPWSTPAKLLESKVQAATKAKKPPPDGSSDDGAMARGRRLEPLARELYSRITGIDVAPLCCRHDDLKWMKASLDGWNDELLLALEIKCPNHLDHSKALDKQVPEKYWPQVQHQLYVTGGAMIHYWSMTDNPKFKESDRVALVEVMPDNDYLKKLVERETEFWNEVTRLSGKGG